MTTLELLKMELRDLLHMQEMYQRLLTAPSMKDLLDKMNQEDVVKMEVLKKKIEALEK